MDVTINDLTLTFHLADGRSVSAPIEWYPRLAHGTPSERNRWELIGRGLGVHWPDLDEDISVENLLSGSPSGESQRSFAGWPGARSGSADLRRDEEGGGGT